MLQPGSYRVAADLMRIRDAQGKVVAFRAWGDVVKVVGSDADGVDVEFKKRGGTKATGRIEGKNAAKLLVKRGAASAPKVLRLDFVDVQQGDAAVLETPDDSIVIVDGGENQMFARYLAARYQGTTAAKPKPVSCVLVTHGDADHYSGLVEIATSETDGTSKPIFLQPERVFHNGLVKGPGSLADADIFGATATVDGRKVVTDLHDDVRDVPDSAMNRPFKAWKKALKHWSSRGTVAVERLERGDDAKFDFLTAEGLQVQVLGPVPIGNGNQRGLPLLSTPGSKSTSASHTINGHSVVLLVTYGNVRFLLAGDLNAEAENTLVADHDAGAIDLTAEVLKVPHHGSADYSAGFLGRVAPVASVVSSGDESEAKEHVHPRATLMGALGRCGRPSVDEPIVFVTELAAFFKTLGRVEVHGRGPVFAFERLAYGIVHCRTDGKRLLVYTHTGKDDKKEAYAFLVDEGKVTADKVTIF